MWLLFRAKTWDQLLPGEGKAVPADRVSNFFVFDQSVMSSTDLE